MEFKKKETKKNLLRNAMIEFEKPLRNLCRSNSLKVNIGLARTLFSVHKIKRPNRANY